MRARRKRVLGPYADGPSWKIVLIEADGTRTSRSCPTKEAAEEALAAARSLIETESLTTVGSALTSYATYLTTQKRLKPRSVDETGRRLRKFLPWPDTLLANLTSARCTARYGELAAELAPDTHRNMLTEGKTFFRWCIDQGWLKESPVAALKGVGRRRRGKPQLRLDEARKWSAAAFQAAAEGEVGAVAALLTLYLDLRASEVIGREVRDLDDGGRLLWIPDSKSEAGRRVLEVPEVLQPLLLEVAGKRAGTEPLFGPKRSRTWLWRWVAKLCQRAGVPRFGAHSMRGLHASLAIERGATGHQVALAMGHSSPAVTFGHYAKPAAVAAAKQAKVISLLGRR